MTSFEALKPPLLVAPLTKAGGTRFELPTNHSRSINSRDVSRLCFNVVARDDFHLTGNHCNHLKLILTFVQTLDG